MNTTIDIADLVQINKLLCNYINKLVTEKAELYNSFLDILNIRADEINNNKNELAGLIKGIEWQKETANRPLLNEWKRRIILQHLKVDDAETLEFEYWVVAALEAYKTALNSTFLTNSACRYILMDQKCFVQAFLLDLIKHRELYLTLEQPVLSV
jgi:hypothetical protein